MYRSHLTLALATAVVLIAACDSSNRRRRPPDREVAEVDSVVPTSVRPEFNVPPDWEMVVNPAGMYFQQPDGFTFGLDAARLAPCDDSTPAAEVPVLDLSFLEEWPLTIAMRRGDINQIARANGFTLDSTDIGTHGGDTTTMERGEGWRLLSGRSNGTSVLFAAVRAPGGCQLIWAARGAELNPDTLGMVLGTLRFGTPPAAPNLEPQ